MSKSLPISAEAAGAVTLGGELRVNRMGFGAMRLTGQGVWGEPADREECKAVLRRAVELGVNFIDTADSYGPEVSERLIAETLYPYAEGLTIGTKGGQLRAGPGQWEPDGRPQHLREVLEGSLRRLRLDQMVVYQLHRPDPKVPFEESVGALAEMQGEGKIRHVGLSNVSADQLSKAQEIVPIVSVQNRYNIAERSSEEVLRACERDGLAFLPWAPLAQDPSGLEGGELLERVASDHNATAGQVMLAWLLQHSGAMLVIPGTSKVSHLEENIAAASMHLSEQEIADLENRLS